MLFNLSNHFFLKNLSVIKKVFRLNIPLFILTLIMYLLRFTEVIGNNIKIIIMMCIVCLQVGIVLLGGMKLFSYEVRPRNGGFAKIESISFKNVFINCYLVSIIAYFVCPISAPSSQDFSSKMEYILYGIVKNHKFVFDLGLFALVCLLGIIILYYVNNRYFKENSELANTLYCLGWISLLPILSAYFYRFIAKPLSEIGGTAKLYNSATDDISVQMLLVFGITICVIVAYRVNKLNSVLFKDCYGVIFQYIYGTILLNIFINNYIISNTLILIFFIAKELFAKKKTSIASQPYKLSGLYWLPTIYVITVSVLFLLNEKGIYIKNYLFVITISLVLFEIVFYVTTKGKFNKETISLFRYIGGLVSITCIKYFFAVYPIVFDYQNYANVYELANKTVASDTLLYGHLPVVDYFSAHALGDVLDRLIYSIIHTDPMGVFVGSNVLVSIMGIMALLYILSQIMPLDFAVVSILLFTRDGAFGMRSAQWHINKYSIKSIPRCWVFVIPYLVQIQLSFLSGNCSFHCHN